MMALDFEISLISFLAISAVQLVLGAALGWFLHISRIASLPSENEAEREKVDEVLHRLHDLTGSLGHNVDRHANRVESIGKELAQAQGKSDGEVQEALLSAMAQISEANARLQGELNSAEKKLQEQAGEIESQMAAARTDALTGIANRRAFDDQLAEYVAQFQRSKAPVSLIMVDVDHFKKFNDLHGHLAGDCVLRDVGGVLGGVARGEDTVARYGGEEFAVLVPGIDARSSAETVRRAIEARTFLFDDLELHVTVSGGMAHMMPGDTPAALIKRADEALYLSKKAGRNRCHWNDGRQCILLTPAAPAEPATAEKRSEHVEKRPVPGKLRAEQTTQRPAETVVRPTEQRVESAAQPVAAPRGRGPLVSEEGNAIRDDLRRSLSATSEVPAPLSLVLFDVDGLERFNEQHGMATGDVVLRAVTQFLTAGLRESDTISRFDGDSFALILRAADLDHATQLSERVRNAISLCNLRMGDQEINFTVSAGAAEAGPGDDADTLILRSSLALQAAKDAGQNRTFYHNGTTSEPIVALGMAAQPVLA